MEQLKEGSRFHSVIVAREEEEEEEEGEGEDQTCEGFPTDQNSLFLRIRFLYAHDHMLQVCCAQQFL